MRHYNITIWIFLIVMMALLSGCAKQEISKHQTLRVGVVLYTQDDPFINALTDCLKANFEERESDDLKIIMTVRDGKNDQSEQNDIVQEIIDAGCDVLCVGLVDRTDPSAIIEMAQGQDIPVIFFNREPVREDLMQWDRLYYVGAEAEQSGIMQGELAAELIQDNKGIDREAGHQDTIIRTDSVVETLMDKGIGLEKLSYQFADWKRSQAENKMTQLIDQYGDAIELVLSNNDEMALGAVNAYNNLGYTDEKRPAIFGIDGLEDALTAVQEGNIQGTVYNDKEGQAAQIANLALDLFQNSSLTQYDFQDQRYIFLPYQKVDASNVADYQKQ